MKKRFKKINILNARMSATVSVTMVLLLLGLLALTAVAATQVTRQIKENLGFEIIFIEDVNPADIDALGNRLKTMDFVKEASLFTADDAMKQWQQETGENVIEVIGVNPFASEYDVKVKAQYASADSLEMLADRFRSLQFVEEVNVRADMVDRINKTMNTLILALSIIAAVLLLISFVLINNTIRLTVYARRFTIHTMKLVGATHSFIRRPFVLSNIVNGIIAGIVADILLAILIYYTSTLDPALAHAVTTSSLVMIYCAVPLAGIVICALTSLWATNRYLNYEYDDLFS